MTPLPPPSPRDIGSPPQQGDSNSQEYAYYVSAHEVTTVPEVTTANEGVQDYTRRMMNLHIIVLEV